MKISRRSFTNLALGALGAVTVPADAAEIGASLRAEKPATRSAVKFFWGTSTSAYQTEGGNTNTDIWQLEYANGSMFKQKSGVWFARDGGWEQQDAAPLFARYCSKVAESFGVLAGVVCTINEINIPAILRRHNYMNEQMRAHIRASVASRIFASNFSTLLTGSPQVLQTSLVAAHIQARQAFKAACPKVPIGMNLAIADDQAVDGGEEKLQEYRQLCYNSYLEAAGQDDFVAIQTYTRNLVGPEGDRKPAATARKTQMGWEFYPEALEHTIRFTAARCHRPIIVTENGIATEKDEERIEYTRAALEGMFRYMRDGIPVSGYFHWSAFDNFEWTEGYRPKFGLIAVDRNNFSRTVKPSARFLGTVARAGRL